jgi:soluble lytic murein transglycosylase-like protein
MKNWRQTILVATMIAAFFLAVSTATKKGPAETKKKPEAAASLEALSPPADEPVCFSTALSRICEAHGVPPRLVQAIIRVESEGNPRALSRKGAMGLMQLMPVLVEIYQVADPFDPLANVEAGVRHLQYLLKEFSGNLPLTLAAYNAGPGAVRKYGGVPPFPETEKYLKNVLKEYQSGRNEWILVSPFLKVKMNPVENPAEKRTPEKGGGQLLAFFQKPINPAEGARIE